MELTPADLHEVDMKLEDVSVLYDGSHPWEEYHVEMRIIPSCIIRDRLGRIPHEYRESTTNYILSMETMKKIGFQINQELIGSMTIPWLQAELKLEHMSVTVDWQQKMLWFQMQETSGARHLLCWDQEGLVLWDQELIENQKVNGTLQTVVLQRNVHRVQGWNLGLKSHESYLLFWSKVWDMDAKEFQELVDKHKNKTMNDFDYWWKLLWDKANLKAKRGYGRR